MSHKHTVFTMNSAHFSKTSVFTTNSIRLLIKNVYFSKTSIFTMNYAAFFKNISFYNELYTVRLGAILKPFWHQAGPVAEQSRAEPSRAGPGRAEPSRAEPSRAKPHRAELRRADRSPAGAEPGRARPGPARPGPAGPGQKRGNVYICVF